MCVYALNIVAFLSLASVSSSHVVVCQLQCISGLIEEQEVNTYSYYVIKLPVHLFKYYLSNEGFLNDCYIIELVFMEVVAFGY